MKVVIEGLKSHQGLHQEQRPVHGAHGTHMQRFWVGGASTPEEHTEHAKLHEKAAGEHAALAKKHGAGLYPDHMPGADPTHAIAAEVALNPHWDPDRGDAHQALAALHRQAAGMAHGLARRVQTGLPTAHQEHHLATVREHIDDQTFYARPSAEVADDLHREREGEDRDAYERDHGDDTPFDVGHPAARLERLKSQMSFSFGGDPGARGLHLEQKQVGGHTQGVWVKSAQQHLSKAEALRDSHPGAARAHALAAELHRDNHPEAQRLADEAKELETHPPVLRHDRISGKMVPHGIEQARRHAAGARQIVDHEETTARMARRFHQAREDSAQEDSSKPWWDRAAKHLEAGTAPKSTSLPKSERSREHGAREEAVTALNQHQRSREDMVKAVSGFNADEIAPYVEAERARRK